MSGGVETSRRWRKGGTRQQRCRRVPSCLPPLTTKGPTTRHYQPYVTRNASKSACHENLTPPHTAGRGSPHPSSCTPPTNLGLVGARAARHDREPGGLQVRVGVSLAEEKGHQATALLAELGVQKSGSTCSATAPSAPPNVTPRLGGAEGSQQPLHKPCLSSQKCLASYRS